MRKKRQAHPMANPQYVTHEEFQEGFSSLQNVILAQGRETREAIGTVQRETQEQVASVRNELGKRIHDGKPNGALLVAVFGSFLVMLGMAAALSANYMRAAVSPMVEVNKSQTTGIDRIIDKMETDDNREEKIADILGKLSARLSANEREMESNKSQHVAIEKLFDAKLEGITALFIDQIQELRAQ
jgi:hypothetical protein